MERTEGVAFGDAMATGRMTNVTIVTVTIEQRILDTRIAKMDRMRKLGTTAIALFKTVGSLEDKVALETGSSRTTDMAGNGKPYSFLTVTHVEQQRVGRMMFF